MTETIPYLSTEKDVTSLNKSFVVKPAKEGSSLGISIVHPNQSSLEEAMKEALKYDDNLIVEAFIDGEEITVPILHNRALTPISIISKNNFYDLTVNFKLFSRSNENFERLFAFKQRIFSLNTFATNTGTSSDGQN